MTHEVQSAAANIRHLVDEPIVTARDIMDRVERRWTRPQTLPALSAGISRQIRALADRPSMTWHEAHAVFGQDPVLAALAIREANTHRKAVSLAEALDVLGLPRIRQLVQRLAVQSTLVRDPALAAAMTRIHHHAWRMSRAVRIVTMYTTLDDQQASTAALMNDLGLLVGLLALGDGPVSQRAPEVEPVIEMLAAGQDTLAWFAADAWGLPAELQTILANGHALEVNGHPHPTLAAILVGRAVVAELGLDLDLPGLDRKPPHPVQLIAALTALGLTDRQFLLIRRQVRESLMG